MKNAYLWHLARWFLRNLLDLPCSTVTFGLAGDSFGEPAVLHGPGAAVRDGLPGDGHRPVPQQRGRVLVRQAAHQ